MTWLNKYWWFLGLLLAVAVAFLAPLASPHPDGLERVAEDEGFIDRAQDAPYSVIPDYVFPGVGDGALATILAGVVGTLVVFGLTYGVAWVLGRSRRAAS